MPSTLTSTVLEQPQTAGNYLRWVKALIEQVKSEDTDGLRKIRLRVGPAKELMEEAFPIGLFASRYFEGSAEVEISLKVGSQSYDAIVSDKRKTPSGISYIEVTLASEGEADHLRMVTLHETGQVSGLDRVSKSGTKKTGQVISVKAEAVSQQEVLARERQMLSAAIERKLDKKYPEHTALVVAFDDVMSHDRADNKGSIEAVLDSFGERLQIFQEVAVVGLREGLFILRTGANAT